MNPSHRIEEMKEVIERYKQRAEEAEAKLAAKPQPVAVVVGKLGAGIRATAFEAAPRPELGQLLYDGPAAAVKLPPKSDVKMGGDVKTRSLLTGMNMMRKSCAEAIRAAGYEVEE